ncbi:histidine kinase dimerization/phospho-acceptor domain-containing protein [Altererythrobacter sp.]|uniref:histidine kinase dimerization/phospho-acceptor domain-containing protein n=1 Tax=Altererythrobacter sp. TaxID=1872480 RepID=UPI003D0F201D
MFFDDRLATVLRHRAAGEHAARTQYRQLLDLLGNRKYGRDESLVAAAWLRLGALGEQIPAVDRARMVAEPGWRFRSAELAAHLAEDEPAVAAAALARANLSESDWEALIPRLPIRARGFLRLRRDLPDSAEAILERLGIRDRGLPQPERESEFGEDAVDDVPGDSAALTEAEQAKPEPDSEGEEDQTVEASHLTEADRIFHDDDHISATDDPAATAARSGPEAPATMEPITAPRADNEQASEISRLVERIAQFRRERESGAPPIDHSPRLPLGEAPLAEDFEITGFGFAADAAGRIEWAETKVAPMVIGKRLISPRRLGEAAFPDQVMRAFSRQLPIKHAEMTLEGAAAISGEWIVDAHPRFARSGGRFHGYVGRFRRPPRKDAIDPRIASEADRIRQLLHELRTPVNALQGYAEVIQQQLFGPAPNEYRALAASIAGDAARIMAGFDELERLAKLETGAIAPASGETDLSELVRQTLGQLEQVLAPRLAGIALEATPDEPVTVALDHDEAETLVWRMLAILAGACSTGETLGASLEVEDNQAVLACDLPAELMAEDDLFAAQTRPAAGGLSAGLFGAGFSLRLARAEARSAGGGLVQDDDRVLLKLPLLTLDESLPSQGQQARSKAALDQG